jgi:hypothetical protein
MHRERNASGRRMGMPLQNVKVMNTVFNTTGSRVDSWNSGEVNICTCKQ